MMIRLMWCLVMAIMAMWGQGRLPKYEVFDTSGRTRIRIDSTSGIVTYDTSGDQRSSITQTFVEVRGGTTTGSRLQPNGIYLRDNVGNQRAYMVSASSPYGGGLFLFKAGGGDKFKVDTGDSDAPDSVNGYKIAGSSVIDATAAATIGITSSGFNTTIGGYFTNGTPRINSSGDGTFRNLSFTGTGPYTGGAGISISTSTIINSVAAAPTSIFLSPPITGSLSSNLLSLACGTCVTTAALGSLGNSLIPTTDNAITVGSPSKRFSQGHFVTMSSGAGTLTAGDGLLEMAHRTSSIRTVLMFGDNGSGTGAGFQFSKAAGTTKFKLDDADSDAPDSINGYKVNGTSALDGSRNANVVNLTMSGTLAGFPTSSSATCGAGEAVKSVSISSAGVISVTCGIP